MIHARWGVAVSANGVVTGRVNLNGTNETSEFRVAASKIVFTNDTNDAGTNPFVVEDGVVKMANAVVTGGLDIGSGTTRIRFSPGLAELGSLSVTDYGGTQSAISTGGTYPLFITGGNINGLIRAGSGASEVSLNSSGLRMTLGSQSIRNADGRLRTSGDLSTDGDLYLGTAAGINRWIYDGGSNRVLRERSTINPTTLNEVIDVLKHHGLCVV